MGNFSSLNLGGFIPLNDTGTRGVPLAGVHKQTWANPTTIDVDGHGAAIDIAVAGSTDVPVGALLWVNDFARALIMVASDTTVKIVTVTGLDQHGIVVSEAFTLNNTTPVAGKVAFKSITLVAWTGPSTGRTLKIGDSKVLGLDYVMAIDTVFWETEDTAEATAGVVVVSSASANADRRGTYKPDSTLNGALDFRILYVPSDFDVLEQA